MSIPVNPVPARPVQPVAVQPVAVQPIPATQVQQVAVQPVVAQPVPVRPAALNPQQVPVSPAAENAKPVFVVEADGVLVTAVGVGNAQTVMITCVNHDIITRVERAAGLRSTIDYVWGVPITAGWDTAEGVVAALLHAAPGRTRLLRAPEETIAALNLLVGPVDPNVVY